MRRTLGTLFGLVLALGLVGTGWSATAPSTSSTTKPATPKKATYGPSKHTNKAQKLGSQVININTASAADLQKVPGIGKSTASKIVKARPFSSVDDLVTKKIMSKKQLGKVRANLSTQ
jgi:competence protein ComEA